MAVDETRFQENGSYEVRADEQTNTLYLTLQGALTRQSMAAAAEETVAAARQLEDGFSVVNDISAFRMVSAADAEPIADAQAALKNAGAAEVVRVVGENTSSVVVNAFRRRSPETGYQARTAGTVEAAEHELGLRS